ncbi:MAG TPA: hypothetical protein VF643_05090 [Sphingomonas sp.]|jgi:hypothetical protein
MLTMVAAAWAVPLAAESPREMLVNAAFNDRDKAQAIARIERAHEGASARIGHAPNDQDALLVQATARGYRAKLTGNRGEAIATRKMFEALVARFPRNPEAQVALGAWHVGLVAKFGGIASRIAVGAQKGIGLTALDRAVALGGDRAMFLGLAGLLRLELDPGDPRAIQLTEAAVRGSTPTAIDRLVQRAAVAVLVPLRRGDRKAAQKLAERVLPLGQFGG